MAPKFWDLGCTMGFQARRYRHSTALEGHCTNTTLEPLGVSPPVPTDRAACAVPLLRELISGLFLTAVTLRILSGGRLTGKRLKFDTVFPF